MGVWADTGSSWCRVRLRTGSGKPVERPAFGLSRPHMVKVGLPGTWLQKPEKEPLAQPLGLPERVSVLSSWTVLLGRQLSVTGRR